MPHFTPVCRTDDVPEGESRMFLVDDRRLAIFHVSGEFFATDDACPHAGASLARGCVEGATVACRIHHWRFCLRTGRYLDADQPRYDVATYPLRVVDGQVEVAWE